MSQNILTGLVGAWCPSLGPSGYTLLDRSGRGNHGTLKNASAANWGAVSNTVSLSLSGTNVTAGEESLYTQSYASIAKDFGSSVDITVSLWIYPTSSNRRSLIGSGSRFDLPRFGVAYATSGTRLIENYRGTSVYSASGVALNKWSHIVITNNGTITQFYIDGRLDATRTQTISQFTQTTTGIGGGYWGTFDGNIADVGIWWRVLAAPEVQALFSISASGLGRMLTGQNRRREYVLKAPSSARRRRILTGMV